VADHTVKCAETEPAHRVHTAVSVLRGRRYIPLCRTPHRRAENIFFLRSKLW